MRYRQLENRPVGFGNRLWGIPIQRVDDQTAMQLVNRALNLGINFFDTAGDTPTANQAGLVLRERQQEAIIATKSMARPGKRWPGDEKLRPWNEYIDLIRFITCTPFRTGTGLKPGGAIEAPLKPKSGIINTSGSPAISKDSFKMR